MVDQMSIGYRKELMQTEQPLSIVVDNPEYRISKTNIGGLLVWERKLFPDDRGFFQELGRVDSISEVLGREVSVKQWSLSYNLPGVLRGIHAEPQDKFITVLSGGPIFIAIVDIRPDSPTFGKYDTFVFDARDPLVPRKTLFVENGLGNSFLVSGDTPVEYFYAVSDVYKTSDGKRAIRWDDSDVAIPWPSKPLIMSVDDSTKHPYLRELYPEKFPVKP